MKDTSVQDKKVVQMTFASVYPHYVNKVVKKGRSVDELNQIITWFTGFDEKTIQEKIDDKSSFEEFFNNATIHPNASKITGLICGYKVEEIVNPLTQRVRYLDKLVDELAKGKRLEKIMRI